MNRSPVHHRIQANPGDSTARAALVEVTLIAATFVICAGWPPPDVNEAHYLSKAKSFWNPDWCPRDHFLNSSDAHFVFYWTFGWITRFCSLPATAWIGRIITWIGLAIALRTLCWTLVPIRFFSVFAVAGMMLLWNHGHLAGEWVVGGVEAKGFSYICVLFGVHALVRGQWNLVWPLFGAASAFHVLVGGWSVVAGLVAWQLESPAQRPPARAMLWPLLIGLALALPGLLPTLALNWDVQPEIAERANRIYAFRRLGHHLAFHQFPSHVIVRHLLLIGIWIAFVWRQVDLSPQHKRLRGFVTGAVSLAVVGFLVDRLTWISPSISASLLRFYWFRLSDALLPVGLVIAAGDALGRLAHKHPTTAARLSGVAAMGIILMVVHAAIQFAADPRPRALSTGPRPADGALASTMEVSQDWVDVCDWIRRQTPADDVFLTPLDQQTFKWYAQRSEWVSWKDVPQDAEAICQWWRRKRIARSLLARSPLLLHNIQKIQGDDNVNWLVLERPQVRQLGLPFEFANRTFAVCRIPPRR